MNTETIEINVYNVQEVKAFLSASLDKDCFEWADRIKLMPDDEKEVIDCIVELGILVKAFDHMEEIAQDNDDELRSTFFYIIGNLLTRYGHLIAKFLGPDYFRKKEEAS